MSAADTAGPGGAEPGEIVICNVNDGEAPRYVISRMLTRAGFRVIEATNGADALALARRELPTVIVLDLKLPDISGMEVCRQLKADPRTASIAILQTSATFVSLEAKVRGLDDGADAFLVQPFTAQELVATVRSLLRLRERETTQLRRAEALVEADQRKDEFLAMLAHELRNPLAAVTTAHEILERYPARDPTEARAREIARRQTTQLGRLVDDLLDVSRVMRGTIALKREPVELGALVEQATSLARAVKLQKLPRRLTLTRGQPVHIDGDPTRLLQVFSNLIDNAIKFTRDDGAIDVSVGEEDGEAVVRVRDDGVGIAADAIGSVFNLFYQAQASIHRSSGGLGIGLTLTRALVELHGGRITARSDGPGRGVEFAVHLPARPADEASLPASSEALAPGGARPVRLLLVEDNHDVREMLANLCMMWGHEVVLACDGLEGARLAGEHRPDLAFVDIGLPGIDGFEVARRIRADPRCASMHLVALTGYGSAEQRAAARAAGFDDHLAKPADPERLAALIASATGGAPRS